MNEYTVSTPVACNLPTFSEMYALLSHFIFALVRVNSYLIELYCEREIMSRCNEL